MTITTRALIIFAKEPVPGRVKTRLSPPFTPEQAAALYDCMLRDVLAKADHLTDVTPIIYFLDEPGAAAFFQTQFPQLESRPQRGADLGARMAAAFSESFERGFGQVAIIGTDLPDLPVAQIVQAFAHLDEPRVDAVFGPSVDGGYYLVGLKRLWPELFQGIPWSTGEVLRLSLERTAKSRILTRLLATWHDVDRSEDLKRPELHDEENGALRTRQFLAELGIAGQHGG